MVKIGINGGFSYVHDFVIVVAARNAADVYPTIKTIDATDHTIRTALRPSYSNNSTKCSSEALPRCRTATRSSG